ncbi:response regulator [Streptomyces lincolnensis]|uniref:response regulator n=1 Tax=Streptomyces TaxID=1883 RepID=UPI0027B9038D|nr:MULTISPECIES: response regulator transcription factor [Streptomyces]MCD7443066.1 response regulator transcription factor [Streptomyces lincolnensis]WLW51669.1 response regulator transcription factor [Streptomyces coralus]
MIRVILADDQPLVRSGIGMLLSAEPDIEVVGEAHDGAMAIDLAEQLQPTVVLMDVRMPGIDGVEATRRITADRFLSERGAPVRVLVLTTYNVHESVIQALRAGASGFLLKDAAPEELVRAVRAVADGDAWLDPSVTPELLREFAARPDRLLPTPAEMENLTAREREVLVLIAHGMSNAEVAQHLVISQTTVKTHYSRIVMKLGVRDRAQAVAAAYQCGLVQLGSTPPPRS